MLHTLILMSIVWLPKDIVPDDVERLLKETYWIHKLETKFPSGFNTKLINNVEYEILSYAANPPIGRIALGRLRCGVDSTSRH